jgi:hypothetical protein
VAFAITRTSPGPHTSRRVTGIPRARPSSFDQRARPFIRSARFGEPADWVQSASLRSQRASRSGDFLGDRGDLLRQTESCPENDSTENQQSFSPAAGGGGSSGNDMRVFQPVRPRW